jgi:hypothetical protein
MKKLIIFIITLSSLYFLNSCTKEYDAGSSSNNPLVLVLGANWQGSKTLGLSDSILTSTAIKDTLNLSAGYMGNNGIPNASDIPVIFQKDNTLVAAYNMTKLANYVMLPDSCYQFTSLQGTILAGARRVTLQIIVFPKKMDKSKRYMLPFTLTNAGGETIVSNLKTILFPMRLDTYTGNTGGGGLIIGGGSILF